jgi:hypothetical protein
MKQRKLKVTHKLDRHGNELCIVDGLPGGGWEASPWELRLLANALIAVAQDAEKHISEAESRQGVDLTYPYSEGTLALTRRK